MLNEPSTVEVTTEHKLILACRDTSCKKHSSTAAKQLLPILLSTQFSVMISYMVVDGLL